MTTLPPLTSPGPFRVDQYHQMIEMGILTPDDPVELIEGWVLPKMPNSPRHYGTIQKIQYRLSSVIPQGWIIRIHGPITTEDSEPEPDLVIARDDGNNYMSAHPGPKDIGLVIEVSLTAPNYDRNNKSRIYARAGIPVYWIVDLENDRIEELSNPNSTAPEPHFDNTVLHAASDVVELRLTGQLVDTIPIAELLP